MFPCTIFREWGIPLFWKWSIPICCRLWVWKELTEIYILLWISKNIASNSSAFIRAAKSLNPQPGDRTLNNSVLVAAWPDHDTKYILGHSERNAVHSHEAWIKANNPDNIWAEKACKWKSAMLLLHLNTSSNKVFVVKGTCLQLFFSPATFWKLYWGRKTVG